MYLENYTAILHRAPEQLVRLWTFAVLIPQAEFYGRDVVVADREFVEQGSDECLAYAAEHEVAFLVVGDPFAATTHTDLLTRCHEKKVTALIEVEICVTCP